MSSYILSYCVCVFLFVFFFLQLNTLKGSVKNPAVDLMWLYQNGILTIKDTISIAVLFISESSRDKKPYKARRAHAVTVATPSNERHAYLCSPEVPPLKSSILSFMPKD